MLRATEIFPHAIFGHACHKLASPYIVHVTPLCHYSFVVMIVFYS
jgi:hypothetical protein